MKRIISKVDRLEDRMKKLEENLVENYDATNEKAFLEVIFLIFLIFILIFYILF